MSQAEFTNYVTGGSDALYHITHQKVDPYVLALTEAWHACPDYLPHPYLNQELQAANLFSRIALKLGEKATIPFPGPVDGMEGKQRIFRPVTLDKASDSPRRAWLVERAWLREGADSKDERSRRGAVFSLHVIKGGDKVDHERRHLQVLDRLARGCFVPEPCDKNFLYPAAELLEVMIGAQDPSNLEARVRLNLWQEEQQGYCKALGEVASAVGLDPLAHPLTPANLPPFRVVLSAIHTS